MKNYKEVRNELLNKYGMGNVYFNVIFKFTDTPKNCKTLEYMIKGEQNESGGTVLHYIDFQIN